MRSRPSFLVTSALIAGIVVATLTFVAPLQGWLQGAFPRAAAEDAIAQAWVPPLHMALSDGFTAFDDDGCPQETVIRWQQLTHLPDSWPVFDWLLGYSRRPAGRVLSLAGLQHSDSARFRQNLVRLVARADLPDTISFIVGSRSQHLTPDGGSSMILHRAALVSMIASGEYSRDLQAVKPPPRRCFW